MKPLLVVAMIAVVALAGCTENPDGPGNGTGGGGGIEPANSIALPEWQVGDWWMYTNSFGVDFTLVVTEDAGATWVMDTDSADMAFFSSAFGEISYLGGIRKSDLAGSQGDTPVKWLDFPLEHGKTWSTQWDGLDFDLVAHVGDDGIAHIQGSVDDLIVNNLVYDDAVGWFTSISFGNPETGEEFGRMDLKDSGSGFSGEAIRVDAEVVMEDVQDGMQEQTFGLFPDGTMATDDGDAYLMLTSTCTTGAYEFGVGTFESLVDSNAGTGLYADQGIIFQDTCPTERLFAGVVSEEPGENQDHWGILLGSQSQDLHLEYTLYLRHFERITL